MKTDTEIKICIIGGDHPRHLYYANTINNTFGLAGHIVQMRESIMPETPQFSTKKDKENYKKHFNDRRNAEEKYFGEQKLPGCPRIEISSKELNSQKTVNFIKKVEPNMVFIFGCGIIKEPLASQLPKETINMHLGLSPRYRGAATLFWPFYFLEPNYAGATFHYIVNEPDAGVIIHQIVPELDIEDKIHDVACKTVMKAAKHTVKLIHWHQEKNEWKKLKQTATGKNFLAADFRPEHLRVIYDTFNNDMVKLFLENKLSSKKPKLFDQFAENDEVSEL